MDNNGMKITLHPLANSSLLMIALLGNLYNFAKDSLKVIGLVTYE